MIRSIQNPVGTKELAQLITPGEKLTIVISDITRFWMRQDLVIVPLVNYLNQIGFQDKDISILIANGTHRPAPQSEIDLLVTSEIAKRVNVVNHYCESEELVYVGTTSRGTEVELHPLVVNQKTICIGAPTHHLMAGFGGGRKSILPGVASKKSINQNHLHTLSPNEPKSNPLIGNSILVGNPLNEDMVEAAAMAEPIFIINMTINGEGKLAKLISGHFYDSWLECCRFVDEIYSTEIPELCDILIASGGGYPKDMSVYQSSKIIDNLEAAVKPRGIMVIVAECIEGGGHPEFFEWAQYVLTGNLDEKLRENFGIPGYVFYLIREQSQRKKIFYMTKANKEDMKTLGINAYDDMDELMKQVDVKDQVVYIAQRGGKVIPRLKK